MASEIERTRRELLLHSVVHCLKYLRLPRRTPHVLKLQYNSGLGELRLDV